MVSAAFGKAGKEVLHYCLCLSESTRCLKQGDYHPRCQQHRKSLSANKSQALKKDKDDAAQVKIDFEMEWNPEE